MNDMTETDILGADQIVILVDIDIWAGMDDHGVKIGIKIIVIILFFGKVVVNFRIAENIVKFSQFLFWHHGSVI